MDKVSSTACRIYDNLFSQTKNTAAAIAVIPVIGQYLCNNTIPDNSPAAKVSECIKGIGAEINSFLEEKGAAIAEHLIKYENEYKGAEGFVRIMLSPLPDKNALKNASNLGHSMINGTLDYISDVFKKHDRSDDELNLSNFPAGAGILPPDYIKENLTD